MSKLTCGDINVICDDGKVIAIERKEVGDLLASIGDGRLFNQAERMANHSNYACVIVTGVIAYDKDDNVLIDMKPTNWKGFAVRAAVWSVMLTATPVILCSEAKFVQSIVEFVKVCDKPGERQHLKPRPVSFPPVDDRVNIVAGIPGVGLKRATALLKFVGHDGQLGNLGDAFMWASNLEAFDEDVRPEGWGSGTIRMFREAMGLKENESLHVISVGDIPYGKETKDASVKA